MMTAADSGISDGRRLTRLRTLGRGASGAVVSLFSTNDGELVAVKSSSSSSPSSSAAAQQLRREAEIMASLRGSPHVLPCLGFRSAAAGDEFQLLLEFAPGGSLADAAARNGGRLDEPAVRAYAADVARGLAYLHSAGADEDEFGGAGVGPVVHGDVKARNVVIGAGGRAMLADFGCARRLTPANSKREGPITISGTPAFMAPEVARGEEQGPAADVWALGCTVIEMATGRAPWTEQLVSGDGVLAAVHLIGYTDAVPEAPEWMSAEGKDFLEKCLRRDAGERWSAAQLLEHPFLASAAAAGKAEEEEGKGKWVSPKSTLDAAFWESDEEEEEDEMREVPESAAERIRALAAAPCSGLPDWESDDGGWIEVCGGYSELSESAAAAGGCEEVEFPTTQCEIPSTAVETSSELGEVHGEVRPPVAVMAAETTTTTSDGFSWGDETEAEAFPDADSDLDVDDGPVHNVGAADAAYYAHHQRQQIVDVYANFTSDPIVLHLDVSAEEEIAKTTAFHGQIAHCCRPPPLSVF